MKGEERKRRRIKERLKSGGSNEKLVREKEEAGIEEGVW